MKQKVLSNGAVWQGFCPGGFCPWDFVLEPFKTLQYGGPLVTLLFLKIEGQNLVGSGILMCFLQKWH